MSIVFIGKEESKQRGDKEIGDRRRRGKRLRLQADTLVKLPRPC